MKRVLCCLLLFALLTMLLGSCGKHKDNADGTTEKSSVEIQMEQYREEESNAESSTYYEDAVQTLDTDRIIFGYITAYDTSSVTFDEVTWVDDDANVNGFYLENGSTQTTSLSLCHDFQIWIYASLHAERPYVLAKMDAEAFADYNASSGRAILWKIAVKNDMVSGIVEKYVP